MDLKNGTKNRGQKSAKNRKVVKDFLKEVFGNIGSISYASSNFIHFRKFPECERSEPLFPLNFVLQFHVLLHSGMIEDFIEDFIHYFIHLDATTVLARSLTSSMRRSAS